MGVPVHLVVYADYVCPFCYLAHIGAERLRADGPIEIENVPFELYPAGTSLPSPDAVWMRNGWTRQVEPLAAELAAEMRYPALVPRTRKAHEAAAYARSEGRGAEMHDAIYRAYWRDGRDIGRIDVLSGIGGEIGLDALSVRIALDVDQWTEQVEQQEQAASVLRLSAVPAYALMGSGRTRAVWVGLMRYEELKAWVERHT